MTYAASLLSKSAGEKLIWTTVMPHIGLAILGEFGFFCSRDSVSGFSFDHHNTFAGLKIRGWRIRLGRDCN